MSTTGPQRAPDPHDSGRAREGSGPGGDASGFWFSRQRREARRAERARAQEERQQAAVAHQERIAQEARERRAEEHRRANTEADALAKVEMARREAEARRRKFEAEKPQRHLQVLDDRVQRLEERLAPFGTPIEQALAAVLPPDGDPADHYLQGEYKEKPYDDSFHPLALRLTRKFMRPDEQVLGAVEASVHTHYTESRNGVKDHVTPFTVVVFTHGFGAKIKGREFRTQTKASFKARALDEVEWDPDRFGRTEIATLNLGDLTIETRSGTSMIFTMLRAQAALQSRPAPKRPRTRSKAAASRPQPRLIRTARDAELVAAEWMTYLGFTHVIATPVGADGGIDVTSDEAVAQVKAESIPTGRPKIQQHHGVAVAHGKTAVFFSLAGYTPQARTYAEHNGLILFAFNLQGEPDPVNPAAHALIGKVS